MPFGNIDGMKTSIPIDKAGRVVLPQYVRRQFHLLAGDRLDLEIRPDGVLLRSQSKRADLVEENGLLVHEGQATDDLVRAVELARAGRDAEVLGLRA
jgi:AbrB family looped-hinge helix DNA binding protein